MAQDLKYMLSVNVGGRKKFTMPQGFLPQVEIHCWGAGGGSSSDGSPGGGGGYAKTVVNINSGDLVKLQVGLPGQNSNYTSAAAGGTQSGYVAYRGGTGAAARDEDDDTGGGGGGGGASSVEINGVPVCVAAGGGGGGGKADDGDNGTVPGLPGGVYRALTDSTDGGSSASGYSTGGGGGGGYLGGAAGASYGDDAGPGGPGSGGQNFGNVIISGAGVTGAGKSVIYFPQDRPRTGDAGYSGYIVMVFNKAQGLKIKNPDGSGNWVNVDNVYYKAAPYTVTSQVTSTPQSLSFSTPGITNWQVPARVTSIKVSVIGGGGGGGGSDSNPGAVGRGGAKVVGTLNVTPGQILTFSIGTGGSPGSSLTTGSGPGGLGGSNNLGYNGGAGGKAGPSGYSGGGGGGGAASSILVNNVPVVVAAGGGGGGGGGNNGAGQGVNPGGTSGSTAGGIAVNKTGDGGGAGGGGGGYPLGGAAGVVGSGDVGGFTGADGQSLVPAGFALAQDTNGGINAIRGTRSAGPGGGGAIFLNYQPSPETLTTVTGGWKEISQIYVKQNGAWKKISQPADIFVSAD